MKCAIVDVGGIRAIVCGGRRYKVQKCQCGRPATKLCDWILERPHEPLVGAIAVSTLMTCDAPICDDCATSPKRGKDLCPEHWTAWEAHPANKQPGLAFGDGTTSAPASDSFSTSSRR